MVATLPLRGIIYVVIGIPICCNAATSMGGASLVFTGIVNIVGVRRGESGTRVRTCTRTVAFVPVWVTLGGVMCVQAAHVGCGSSGLVWARSRRSPRALVARTSPSCQRGGR